MKATSLLTIVSLCLWTGHAGAAEFPGDDVPSNVGVVVHITPGYFGPDWVDFDSLLDEVQQAGIGVVRTDFAWCEIEQTKHVSGADDWNFTKYDAFVTAAADRGIRVMATLYGANGLYGDTTDPVYYDNPDFYNAYAAYAGAVANHYSYLPSDLKMTFELWNEPNGSGFWPRNTTLYQNEETGEWLVGNMELEKTYVRNAAAQYTAMATQAAASIRENDPLATIVAPALSWANWTYHPELANEYIDTCFSYESQYGTHGLLDSATINGQTVTLIDGLSVHPYRVSNPETVTDSLDSVNYADIQNKITTIVPGSPVKIISGEWGYTTTWGGMTAQKQADYAAREMLTNLSQGIPFSNYYNFKDYGNDPNEGEYHFGLTANDGTRKPAYYAMQALNVSLDGKNLSQNLSSGNDWKLEFNGNGRKKLAAWTTGTAGTRTITGYGKVYLNGTPVYLGELQQWLGGTPTSWSAANWSNSTGGGNGNWVTASQALFNSNTTIDLNTSVCISGLQFSCPSIGPSNSTITNNSGTGYLQIALGAGAINVDKPTIGSATATINAPLVNQYVACNPAACQVRKTGGGTLVLNARNTFTGNLIIAEGKVKANVADALYGPVVTLKSTATNGGLEFGSGTTFQIGSLAGDKNLNYGTRSLIVGESGVSNDADGIGYSGILSGSGTIYKYGTGTFLLSGANTNYTGITSIHGGMVAMANDQALGGASNPYNIDLFTGGGIDIRGCTLSKQLAMRDAGPITLANTAMNTSSTYTRDLSLSGDITVNAVGTLNLPGTFATNTYGAFRTLTKTGSGILNLSGASDNAFMNLVAAQAPSRSGTVVLSILGKTSTQDVHAAANVTVEAGATVQYGGSGQYQVWQNGAIVLNGGTVDFNGNTQIGTSMAITQTGSKIANSSYGVQYAPSEIAVAPGVQSFEVNTASCLDLLTGITCDTSTGVWSNLIKTGTGRLMLNGPSDNTHLTLSVWEGDVQLYKESGPNVHAAAAMAVYNGARVWYSGSGDYQMDPGHWVRLEGGTIDLNGRTQRGTSLIVENANSVLENTGSTAALYVPNSITLDTDLNVNTVGHLEIDGSIVRGTGVEWPVLGKLGNGELILSGTTDNSNLTLNAAAGTICLNKQNTSIGGVHAATAAIVRSGATLKYTGSGDYQIANGNWIQLLGGTLDLNGKNQAYVALTSAFGYFSTLANTAIGTTSTFTSPYSITLDAPLTVNATGNMTIDAVMTGSSVLAKTGNGTLTLTKANTYSGGTTVNAGTLTLNNSGTINSSSGITLNAGGTLLNNSQTELSCPIAFNGGTYGGTGAYGGNMYVGNGHLAPSPGSVADQFGTICVNNGGDLILNSSSILDFDFSSTTSSVCDAIVFNDLYSEFILDGATLNITSSTGWVPAGDYTIISGFHNYNPGILNFGSVPVGHNWSYNVVANGSCFDLVVTAAPEPGTIAILATALLSFLAYVWRKRK